MKSVSDGLQLRLLQIEDFLKVVEWNRDMDEHFLYQWAGRGYDYPITIWQYSKRLENGVNKKNASTYIYAIETDGGEMIGTIELTGIDYDKKLATIGRFIIGPKECRGKGYGQKALTLLIEKAFSEFGLRMLFLKVFDFNVGAVRCYEQVGFKTIKYDEGVYEADAETWNRLTMVLAKVD